MVYNLIVVERNNHFTTFEPIKINKKKHTILELKPAKTKQNIVTVRTIGNITNMMNKYSLNIFNWLC